MSVFRSGVRLFALDLDDTISVENGEAAIFKEAWEILDPHQRPLLVYNSGQSIADTGWFVLQHRLPTPEFIIGSLGTELLDPLDPAMAAAFHTHIGAGWNRDAVEAIVREIADARLQPPALLSNFKLGWHWPRASRAELFRLEYRLRDAGLSTLTSYSNNVLLDIIPPRAGKGNALAWLCHRIGVQLEDVVVAGVGANNASMFALPHVRGFVLANASAELLGATRDFRPIITRDEGATGVIAGLRHFGIFSDIAEEAPRPS